jgi:hypothetical protein
LLRLTLGLLLRVLLGFRLLLLLGVRLRLWLWFLFRLGSRLLLLLLFGLSRLFLLWRFLLGVLACLSGDRKSEKQKQRRCTDNSNWFHEDSPLPRIRPRAILRV